MEINRKINFLLLWCAAPASASLIAQQGASQKEAFFLPFWKGESILWLSFASPKSVLRPYPLPPTHNLHFTNTNKCANLPKYCDAAPLLKKCRGYNLTRNDTQDFRTNSRCLSHLWYALARKIHHLPYGSERSGSDVSIANWTTGHCFIRRCLSSRHGLIFMESRNRKNRKCYIPNS